MEVQCKVANMPQTTTITGPILLAGVLHGIPRTAGGYKEQADASEDQAQ